MREDKHQRGRRTDDGFSYVETLIVVAIIGLFIAIAIPQMISSRRLLRSASLPREIISQLRFARQEAMSQRRAITFQYDDATKRIKIFNHGPNSAGTAILSAAGYPNTGGSTTMLDVPLTSSGLSAGDISYGIPSGLPGTATGQLSDKTSLTALTNNKVNITFQPDGSVVNTANAPVSYALYFYNPHIPQQTAVAISVLGTAGRVKPWRFTSYATKYVE